MDRYWSLNFLSVTLRHDVELAAYFEEWALPFQPESDSNGLPRLLLPRVHYVYELAIDSGCRFRCTLLPLFRVRLCVWLSAT